MIAKILVVDDEASICEFLEIFFGKMGLDVYTVSDGLKASSVLEMQNFDVVLTDLKMPGMSGIDVLSAAKAIDPLTQVIVMTAYSTTDTAIDAMKKGAYDYVTKPFKIDEMRATVERAIDKRRTLQADQGRPRAQSSWSFDNIVGKSEQMQSIFTLVKQIAPTRSNVLISGESGTGKELIARAIHQNSPRSAEPFVVINCGVIPENLMESELFGHVKGSFTGAVSNKKGLFEIAHGGTLFLDEIAELPLHLQVKLLRVLQEKQIKPVGGLKEADIDVRIVAATNRTLEIEVESGRFREDLFYRLNVIRIHLPPLRERKADIPFIANYFLEKYGKEMGKALHGIDAAVISRLLEHHFSGNIRELENIVERAVAVEQAETITLASLPELRRPGTLEAPEPSGLPQIAAGFCLDDAVAEFERQLILNALSKAHGVKTEAAKLLGISFRAIRYKIEKHAISDDESEL